MNREQQLSFNYGSVVSVSASKGLCILQTSQMQIEVKIPTGKTYQAIPAVGETWSYYRNGTSRVLNERISKAPTDDEAWLFPGDALVSISGTLHQKAVVIDQQDDFGEFFNPITHLLNPARQNGTPIYAVAKETDDKSVDGQDIKPPCLLAIVSGSNVSLKYRSE